MKQMPDVSHHADMQSARGNYDWLNLQIIIHLPITATDLQYFSLHMPPFFFFLPHENAEPHPLLSHASALEHPDMNARCGLQLKLGSRSYCQFSNLLYKDCLSVCLSKCVPLVLEHFGRWGEEALRFLNQLSRKNQNVVQFKSHRR